MKLKSRARVILIIILGLPVFAILISSVFFISSWRVAMEDSEEVIAPRFIRPHVKQILDGTHNKQDFFGIILMLDHEGELLYLLPNAQERMDEMDDMSPQMFYKTMMEQMPEQPFSFSVYRYQGNAGLVVYVPENFNRLHLTRVAWVILFFFYLGFILLPAMGLNLMIRPIMKSLLRLEKSALEIGKGNLDIPVKQSQLKKGHGLHMLEDAMEKMRLELKEDHERQARIIMSVSHDLKTPLTSIKGYVEALEDEMASTPEERKKYTSIIKDKTSLLEERISELIHFTQLRTTQWQARFAPIEIGELLAEMDEIFRNDCLLLGRKYQSQLKIPSGVKLQGDRKMLFQVLENLFDNAGRFTETDEIIRFRGEVIGETLSITLEDSGPGISKEHQPHIFETFYRAEGGRNSRGMGIGLASAEMIIRNHGGSITYFDSELGGAGFRLELIL